MRRDRRFKYQWDEEEEQSSQRQRPKRPDVGRMIIKWLPWAILGGIVIFFLEQWLKG